MPKVFVGIGSNIDRENSIRAGVGELRRYFGELQLSPVYESEAVGFDGDRFYNLVAAFESDLEIEQILGILSDIEDRHGRVRGGERFSPRTLDIDLLLYGDSITRGDGYQLPRDEIPRYAFVLRPLAELAPQHRHPETGLSFREMWQKFDKQGQELKPIAFPW